MTLSKYTKYAVLVNTVVSRHRVHRVSALARLVITLYTIYAPFVEKGANSKCK